MKKRPGKTRGEIPGNPGETPGNAGEIPGNSGNKPRERPKPRGIRPPSQRVRCGAKARSQGGKPCRRWAMIGRKRCPFHGGKTPRGQASPHYVHGFYSQLVPRDIADLARKAHQDPELKNLGTLIALLDVDIRNAAAQTADGAAATRTAQAALAAFRKARTDGDTDAQATAERTLGEALDRLAGQERAWAKLWDLAERKDRLLTGEVNRHKATADTINADRVAQFMVGMIDALKEESEDRDLLKRVLVRWERLMGLAGVTAPVKSS